MSFVKKIGRIVSRQMPKVELPADVKAHVLSAIERTEVGEHPFYHAWIEEILPEQAYRDLHAFMISLKRSGKMQARLQDNPKFVNRRYSLFEDKTPAVGLFRAIWSDSDIKRAIFAKFYMEDSVETLVENAVIHKEFEFVFCEPSRFQNVHVDIPPKVLSFVFYLPDGEVSDEEELQNATILYDRELQPQYAARFRDNSVCVFAQHHYSYHGFSSTIERDALVMFMVDPDEMERWTKISSEKAAPFEGFLNAVDDKLGRYKLLEYGMSSEKVEKERELTRVNAPKGRVLFD